MIESSEEEDEELRQVFEAGDDLDDEERQQHEARQEKEGQNSVAVSGSTRDEGSGVKKPTKKELKEIARINQQLMIQVSLMLRAKRVFTELPRLWFNRARCWGPTQRFRERRPRKST